MATPAWRRGTLATGTLPGARRRADRIACGGPAFGGAGAGAGRSPRPGGWAEDAAAVRRRFRSSTTPSCRRRSASPILPSISKRPVIPSAGSSSTTGAPPAKTSCSVPPSRSRSPHRMGTTPRSSSVGCCNTCRAWSGPSSRSCGRCRSGASSSASVPADSGRLPAASALPAGTALPPCAHCAG